MPINASYEYTNAEKEYWEAKTPEEKLSALQKMMSTMPTHKGTQNLRAGLNVRYKKLQEKIEKGKSVGKVTKKGIKKEGIQTVLVGFTNVGKSSLLSKLTNAKPKVDSYQFTTMFPEIGTMKYEGIQAQIVDLPSIGSEYFDIGIINTADIICIVLEKSLNDLEKILPMLSKASGKKIIVINKMDLLSKEELRKLEAQIKSRKLEGLLISSQTGEGLEELKKRIIMKMNVIRIYTKEPGKPASSDPVVLSVDSTVKDVAESILKGFSKKVKESRVTGPSSKFPNQKVGLSHVLKDKDIVEFRTK